MIYSKQKIFCNTCGKEMLIELPRVIGRDYKVCSLECWDEIKWRETLSICNTPYRPQKEETKA